MSSQRWMSNWQYAQKVPSVKWRSAMTLPRQLTLHQINNDYIVKSKPVNEVKYLEGESKILQAELISKPFKIMDNTSTAKLSLSFHSPEKGYVTIRFSNDKGNYTDVGFDATSKKYFIDRSKSGLTDFSSDFKGRHSSSKEYHSSQLHFEIYLDHSSIEMFAEDGSCVMTDIYFAENAYTKAEVLADQNNPLKITKGTVTTLRKMDDSSVLLGMN
jgi:sucrose-6-phosphate hydrolase SacC (GH32 family)